MEKLKHQVPKNHLKNPVRIGVFRKDMPGRVAKAEETMKNLDRNGNNFSVRDRKKLIEIFVGNDSLADD